MIKNKILKTELVEWRNLKWFQPVDFKHARKENIDKLKNSLIKNGFSQPFAIWQKENDLWILDGHYRKMAFDLLEKDNIEIPGLLPANFIDCKNEREAKKIVLIYNSHYARINKDEIFNFTNDLDLKELSLEIELPNIDLALMIDDLGQPLDLGDIAETGFQYEERIRIEQEANRIANEKFEKERESLKKEILENIKIDEIPENIKEEIKKEKEVIEIDDSEILNNTNNEIKNIDKDKVKCIKCGTEFYI